MKRLCKSSTDVKISGVCGGISEYLGIDATVIRLVFAISALFGAGLLAYIICVFIMPVDTDVY